jgi:signal peptidase
LIAERSPSRTSPTGDNLKPFPSPIPYVTRNLSGLLAPAAAVLLVAVVVAAVAGAWPPFVAVESGSMAPEVERGDLVVVTSTDRFPWGGLVGAAESGAPTTFGSAGDVIVFDPPDDGQRPILHRIAFPVTDGEDWTDRADPALLDGDCSTIAACPAPHDGYITYGDANGEYDQSAGIAPVVREEWITAKALFSVPNLGWFRIGVDAAIARLGVLPTAVGFGGLAAVTGGFGAVLLGRITARRDRSDHGERGGRNR